MSEWASRRSLWFSWSKWRNGMRYIDRNWWDTSEISISVLSRPDFSFRSHLRRTRRRRRRDDSLGEKTPSVSRRASANWLGERLRWTVGGGPLAHPRMGQWRRRRLLPAVQTGHRRATRMPGHCRRVRHLTEGLGLQGQHQPVRGLSLGLPLLRRLSPATQSSDVVPD